MIKFADMLSHDWELTDLVAEGHAALSLPPAQRAQACLIVMPKLINALDRVDLYRHEWKQVRLDLTVAIGNLRREVNEAQKRHPGYTYAGAPIHAATKAVNLILDRLDRLLYEDENGRPDGTGGGTQAIG